MKFSKFLFLILAFLYNISLLAPATVSTCDGGEEFDVSSRQLAGSPGVDMCLSPYPQHPCQPIFLITFPRGQRMLILGTTHTVPLGCFFSYSIAQEIIEWADFIINEINGRLLSGGALRRDEMDPSISPYMTPSRIDTIKRAVMQSNTSAESLASAVQSMLDIYMPFDDPDVAAAKAALVAVSMKAINERNLAKIFDTNDQWYHKAGLRAGPGQHIDYVLDYEGDHATTLKIQGKIFQVRSKDGQEFHPMALSEVFRYCTGSSSYLKPACGGVDDHFDAMATGHTKLLYALEKHKDRYGPGFMKDLSDKIDAACSTGNVAFNFNYAVDQLKEKNQGNSTSYPSTLPTFTGLFPGFYEEQLFPDIDPALIDRNELWAQKYRVLNETRFRTAFSYVGARHLHDLFVRLKAAGFEVSERLTLPMVEEILLDERRILEEHVMRKDAMRQQRYFKSLRDEHK